MALEQTPFNTCPSCQAPSTRDLADATTWRVNAAIEAGRDDAIDEIVAEFVGCAGNISAPTSRHC